LLFLHRKHNEEIRGKNDFLIFFPDFLCFPRFPCPYFPQSFPNILELSRNPPKADCMIIQEWYVDSFLSVVFI